MNKLHYILLLFFALTSYSQEKPTSKWLGNSWNANLQYSYDMVNEYSLNAGRTYGKVNCGCMGCFYFTSSYGLGYSKLIDAENNYDLVKAYYEYGMFTFPPFNPLLRIEYNYIPKLNQSLIKPEIGFNFVHFDVTYSYAFNLNTNNINPIKHGLNLRIKLFLSKKKWERNNLRVPKLYSPPTQI